MDKVTRLVAARLASKQKQETDHPDSNSLLAFAEGSLSTVERQNMLSHLATCLRCRDVLASSSAPVRVARQARWRTRAKWIAATAALLVVTTALWRRTPASKQSVLPPPAQSTTAAAAKSKSPITRRPFQPDLISSRIFQPQPTTGRSFADGAESLWQLGNSSGQAGTLRKSTDGGSTWQPVFSDARAHLYALSIDRSDIWIGGSNGALFHSPDEGSHWVAVSVRNRNMRLKESITGIDTRNGIVTVRTSSATRWSTNDGGSHWRLQ